MSPMYFIVNLRVSDTPLKIVPLQEAKIYITLAGIYARPLLNNVICLLLCFHSYIPTSTAALFTLSSLIIY